MNLFKQIVCFSLVIIIGSFNLLAVENSASEIIQKHVAKIIESAEFKSQVAEMIGSPSLIKVSVTYSNDDDHSGSVLERFKFFKGKINLLRTFVAGLFTSACGYRGIISLIEGGRRIYPLAEYCYGPSHPQPFLLPTCGELASPLMLRLVIGFLLITLAAKFGVVFVNDICYLHKHVVAPSLKTNNIKESYHKQSMIVDDTGRISCLKNYL